MAGAIVERLERDVLEPGQYQGRARPRNAVGVSLLYSRHASRAHILLIAPVERGHGLIGRSGPPTMRGQVTKQELFCGKLKESDLDASVRRVLGLAIHARASDVPSQGPEGYVDDTESRALLRKSAAAACVLLKHDRQVLPIDKARKIAVIGSNGRIAAVSGGGSASMSTLFATTPLAGIQTLAQETGASVSYSIGAASHLFLPEITPMLRHPSGDPSGIAQVEFWIEGPCPGFNGRSLPRPVRKPDFATSTRTANAFIADGVPNEILASAPYIRVSPGFVAQEALNVVQNGRADPSSSTQPCSRPSKTETG
jgi:hypothetical protein